MTNLYNLYNYMTYIDIYNCDIQMITSVNGVMYSVSLPIFDEACLPLISQGALVLVTSNG